MLRKTRCCSERRQVHKKGGSPFVEIGANWGSNRVFLTNRQSKLGVQKKRHKIISQTQSCANFSETRFNKWEIAA